MVEGVLILKAKALVHRGYDLSAKFPRDEIFGLTSQVRRALISVPSNVVEGYARMRNRVFLNHLEIAYASLAEVKYQMSFACERGYIDEKEYDEFNSNAEEVSKMLWSSINTMRNKFNIADEDEQK